MKQTQQIMGMPILLEIVENSSTEKDFNEIFSYFHHVDQVFSTYKKESEITKYNNGEIKYSDLSGEVKNVLNLADETKKDTQGYFDITTGQGIDPSGIVKGWAIQNAAVLLKDKGFTNFMIDAGGDIATSGKNSNDNEWKVGIRNPFHENEIIKVISPKGLGVATSGTYQRGNHIYNPFKRNLILSDIKSITVIGPTVYDADRFATAAFAMGRKGIEFIEGLAGYEAYMIDERRMATMTTGFTQFVV